MTKNKLIIVKKKNAKKNKNHIKAKKKNLQD